MPGKSHKIFRNIGRVRRQQREDGSEKFSYQCYRADLIGFACLVSLCVSGHLVPSRTGHLARAGPGSLRQRTGDLLSVQRESRVGSGHVDV